MRSRIFCFCLTIFLLSSNFSRGQFQVITLKKGKQENWLHYSFPLFKSSNEKAVKRINEILQSSILSNDSVMTDTARVFETSRYIEATDSNAQSGYSAIDYRVELNNNRVLSVAFDLESTGAYSENYSSYYCFNSADGEQLSAKQVFGTNNLAAIKQILLRERKKRVKQWITEMTQSYNIAEDSSFIRETFAECLANTEENNFLIKKSSIVFYKEYCFPHMARPYDTDLNIELKFADIEKYLSDPGKKLLGVKN